MRGLLLSLLLAFSLGGCQQAAFAQASPYNLFLFKAQAFTATGQTGAAIQLNGLVIPSTIGSSYASGTITVTGVALTTVSFQVMGSSDNGATYYLLPVYSVVSPSASPVTTVTATAAGLYQFNLAGLTHVKLVTTGTFTATSVSFTLSASPNASISRNGNGGAVMSLTSPDDTIDVGVTMGAATVDLDLTAANTWLDGMTIQDGLTVDQIAISSEENGINFPSGSQVFENLIGESPGVVIEAPAVAMQLNSTDGTNTGTILELLGVTGSAHPSVLELNTGAATGYVIGTSISGNLLDASNTYETQLGIGVDGGGDAPPVWAPSMAIGNVTTTIRNTNVKLLGVVTAANLNLDFYVAATPSTCAGGTTPLDCAWIAATAYAVANNVQPIVHLAPGTNATCNGLSTTAQHRPSIMGNGMSGLGGSIIQQTCSVSFPTVNYGCNGTGDSEATHLERFAIDANNLAPQALAYFGQNISFLDHLYIKGANGSNNFAQIGSSSCTAGTTGSTFQINVNDIYVDGKGTGPASWARGTVAISGGVPSVTVTTPGLYNHQNPPGYLVGYGSGANPCSTMGTVAVTTAASGGQFTVSSVALSGFSGCVAGVGAYIYIPDMPLAAYGIDFQFFTDSVVNMLATNGVGHTASIHNENSANTFVGAHPYNAYVGIKDDSGGNWYGVDCDSNQIMFSLTAPTRVHGCNIFYNNSTAFPGAAAYLLGAGSNGSLLEGTNAITGSENADYHEFVPPNGPWDTGQSAWPQGTVDFGSQTAGAVPAIIGKHDATANQVDETVGFVNFATSSANSQAFSRKWTQSVYNGSTHVEETWGLAPIAPASGTPTQDFMHVTPPSNEVVASPSGNVGWLFDPLFAATISNNSDSQVLGIRDSYNNGTLATTIGWNIQSKLSAGATPTHTLFLTPTSCPSGNCVVSTIGQIAANVPNGTPPLSVISTTPVPTLTLANDSQLPTNVTPGNCTVCSATYNAQGIVTAYSSGSASVVRTASGYCTGTATASATGLSVTNLGGNNFACTGTSGSAGMLLIGSGTLSNLSVRCNTTGVSTLSGVFTLSDLRAGTNTVTPLTVTYGTTAAGTMLQDTTHTYAYLAGDMLRLNFTTQASETLANCDVSFNY